jgi:CelD/BcsL family acetyltransferase involved in cellulose biosynthesis
MDGDRAQDVDAARRLAGAASAAAVGAVVSAGALQPLTPEWGDLASDAAEPNAFYAPAMLIPALGAFADEKPDVIAVRDAGGRLIGLAPVAPLKGYSRLPIRYVSTWMHKHCFFAAPLVRHGHERAFFHAFFDAVEQRGAFLRLRHLDASGPLFTAAAAVAAETGRLSAPSARYTRAMLLSPWTTDDYLKGSMSGKKRKDLRRLRSRLNEEGAVSVDLLGPGEDIAPWADEFLELEASGWKGKAGTAMGAEPASAQFFRQAADAAHRAGELQLFRLRSGARTIAAAVNFRSAGALYAFKVAYDETYARFSPGVMLEIEMMKAIEGATDLCFIDSCAKAEHPMIERLWRERRTIEALNISRRDAAGKAIFRVLTGLERASERRRAAEAARNANDDQDPADDDL